MVLLSPHLHPALPAPKAHRRLYRRFLLRKNKLVIELDGAQHYTPEQQQTDSLRTEFFAQNHIRVLRFTNLDIDRRFDGVCQTIEAAVQAAV